MHWVDRGAEPDELSELHERYAQGWINYYDLRDGKMPTDAHWRKFADELRASFADLCAYCEGIAKGEVDHFRPKSKFPQLVYSWSNWLFACHDCNHAKGSRWPDLGYVDPCTATTDERPERYFDFDLETGMILAGSTVNEEGRQRAKTMIRDLKLNARHHLQRRLRRRELVVALLESDSSAENGIEQFSSQEFVSRSQEYSSFLRVALAARGLWTDSGDGE